MGKLVTLAKDLKVPAAELATKVVAALGMRGSGKSNVMAVIAEQLLEAGIQVVVLDDVGIWFSLRLKPDGKTPSGLNIPVMGGRHGDIALLPTAGELVARTLAETASSAVLDISGFRKGERARFAAAFAEAFFHAKKEHPGPCFLVLEESQRWVPQVIRFKGEGEERMLGAFMEIAEVGRNYGIGLGLLSQRPQKVHKEVLNLTELLLAFQTNGVLERKAIAEWVQEAGVPGRDQVNLQLPGLPTGEALVWSPSWLRIFRSVRLPKKETYDAGATPLTARAAVKTKPLDIGALSAAMQTVTEEAKANDPKELRAEIARLRRELQSKKPEVQAMVIDTIPTEAIKALERAWALAVQASRDSVALAEFINALRTDLTKRYSAEAKVTARPRPANGKPGRWVPEPGEHLAEKLRPGRQLAGLGGGVASPSFGGDDQDWRPTGGALRMVQAIATSQKDGLTWKEVARLAVMKHSGGSFATYKSQLRTHGCVEEKGGLVYLTPAGRGWAGEAPVLTGRELLAFWKEKLQGKAKLMLDVLVTLGRGETIGRKDLAEQVGMEAGGGSFATYLSALRSNGLVVDTGDGLRPADVFLQ